MKESGIERHGSGSLALGELEGNAAVTYLLPLQLLGLAPSRPGSQTDLRYPPSADILGIKLDRFQQVGYLINTEIAQLSFLDFEKLYFADWRLVSNDLQLSQSIEDGRQIAVQVVEGFEANRVGIPGFIEAILKKLLGSQLTGYRVLQFGGHLQ